MAIRSGPPAPSVPPVPMQARGPAPALTATVDGGALVLASGDGQVRVRVPFDEAPLPVPPSWDRRAPDVAHVCLLDTALSRRLFRRVSAWHVDPQGRLSARVRPTA